MTPFDIKDFGAKGDGQTNDHDAFVAAAAAINKQGGGKLIISPGTYIVGKQFVYNQGNIAAKNIKVNDYIPCGYVFANNPTWTLMGDTAMTIITSTIQPGDSAIVSIQFTIEPCSEEDAWKNVGEIAASQDEDARTLVGEDAAKKFPESGTPTKIQEQEMLQNPEPAPKKRRGFLWFKKRTPKEVKESFSRPDWPTIVPGSGN